MKSATLRALASLAIVAATCTTGALAAGRIGNESMFVSDAYGNQPQRLAAEGGLRQWIDHYSISGAAIDDHFILDVTSLDQLRAVRLGQGFQVETLDSSEFLAGSKVAQASHAANEWRFIVTLDERAVGLVDVRKIGEKFEFTGLGAKELALDIQSALLAHPGKEAHFIRSYEATADFLRLQDRPTGYVAMRHADAFAPLMAARVAGIGSSKSPDVAVKAGDSVATVDENTLSAGLRAAIARNTH